MNTDKKRTWTTTTAYFADPSSAEAPLRRVEVSATKAELRSRRIAGTQEPPSRFVVLVVSVVSLWRKDFFVAFVNFVVYQAVGAVQAPCRRALCPCCRCG